MPNERCQDEQLAAELVERPDLSTATREGLAIVLTNVSEYSRSYYGGPGVLLLGADGAPLASRDDKIIGPIEPEAGALAPGEPAQVEALLTDVATYDCTPATVTTIRVLVTSDGAGPGIEAPADLQVCGDAWTDFTVGSYVPVSRRRPMPRCARRAWPGRGPDCSPVARRWSAPPAPPTGPPAGPVDHRYMRSLGMEVRNRSSRSRR